MLRHIVMFRIHEDVSDDAVTEAVVMLRSLEEIPAVRSWRVERSTDERKGRVIIEEASFDSTNHLRAFQADPRHVSVGKRMSSISDWWVADYVT